MVPQFCSLLALQKSALQDGTAGSHRPAWQVSPLMQSPLLMQQCEVPKVPLPQEQLSQATAEDTPIVKIHKVTRMINIR